MPQTNQVKQIQNQVVSNPQTNIQPAAMCYQNGYAQPAAQSFTTQVPPNYSGVNIQIFNPSVSTPGSQPPVYNVNAPSYGTQQPCSSAQCYPSNYYTENFNNKYNSEETTRQNEQKQNKKTEKRKIVQLTDEYIKNLENYLNSQDKEVRMMGAKEVVARLEEDESRKDDLALTALINKMLQDPYAPVRTFALGALSSRMVTGNDYTVGVLKNMQNNPQGYGHDSLQATDILLKMSGQTIEKEFDVTNKPEKTQKSENKE